MTIEFKLLDFFYPASILKLKSFFDKSQWFSHDELVEYQEKKLREIISHAYNNVPYYSEIFDKLKLKPDDIKSLQDLEKLPLLTKQDLKNNFKKLQARNMHLFKPKLVHTSGTSGERVSFYADKPSNVLEFVYYWRYWGWAGYKLGDRFAEFSSYFFMKSEARANDLYHFSKLSNRLILNSLFLSEERVDSLVEVIRRYKPLFLKSLPSVLYYFALFLRDKGVSDLNFKAIFSTGEMLLQYQRKLIEKVFSCKVYDSYGHMERTVAISECSHSGMHINQEYGILELLENKSLTTSEGTFAKGYGTSLHNLSMPLLRYETGDIFEICENKICNCGRNLPLVNKIIGRENDTIATPSGKLITTIFIAFNDIQEIDIGQIVQKEIDKLEIRIVKSDIFSSKDEELLLKNLKSFTHNELEINVKYLSYEELRSINNGKFRSIISNKNKIGFH